MNNRNVRRCVSGLRDGAAAKARAASLARLLRSACFFISITAPAASFAHLGAQQVTTLAPPASIAQSAGAESSDVSVLPEAAEYPDAIPVPQDKGELVNLEYDTLKQQGNVDTLDGHVTITYRDHTLHADHIEYDNDTGDATLTGHVVVDGGENSEHIEASHGTFNMRTETGRFYDVTGSVGLKRPPKVGPEPAARRGVYANSNPFLFTGKILVKTGPRGYEIYQGTFTSCQLPHPDWLLSADKINADGTKAHAGNSIFHLMGLPLLWLPYVTHPVDASDRQSGILIPDIGFNSASKGDTIGEQIYWAINRSTDLTVGTIYYSARGWERTAAFRYRGLGQDFAKANYSALQDRGYTPSGGTYINQSGTDALFSGRKDLIPVDESAMGDAAAEQQGQARMVADVEYLSSYPYREAFSSSFNQAVSSDVVSTIYGIREWDGMAASLEGDRYQGEKRIATTVPLQTEEQVRIFHAPSLEFTTTDHALGTTGLEWNVDSSVTALKRTQPGFATGGMVERLDVHPELIYPLHFDGWNLQPSVAGRETFYSRSRLPTVPGVAGPPVESLAPLNRADLEVELDLRPPVLERTFDSGFLRRLLRQDVKHTIEPELTYRYVTGIDNFPDILRFDVVDVASNTNEVEYGVTQRLFLRRTGNQPCSPAGAAADATEILGSAGKQEDAIEAPGEAAGRTEDGQPVCGNREWISWRVAQKYFFDSHFGGAVEGTGPRGILDTTLNFSGISFLTGPRDLSPLISRLRVRTSEKTDFEWDFDYDPIAGKFTANNVYGDVHWGDPTDQSRKYFSAGFGFARLNAPARSYVEGVLSSVANFSQMRVLAGYGKPTRPGFSAAASAGIDLDLGTVQYGAIQTSYNWNCCGVSVEYRKYELGTARNDNGYKFNFTLANIGSAGNLRHAEQVF